jgi:hypothetical protein
VNLGEFNPDSYIRLNIIPPLLENHQLNMSGAGFGAKVLSLNSVIDALFKFLTDVYNLFTLKVYMLIPTADLELTSFRTRTDLYVLLNVKDNVRFGGTISAWQQPAIQKRWSLYGLQSAIS